MNNLSPASEILLRNENELLPFSLLFFGDFQDNFPAKINAKNVQIHCNLFHHFRQFSLKNAEITQFSLFPELNQIQKSNRFVFYWTKNKLESEFLILALLSQLKIDDILLISGENRSGIRHVEKFLAPFGHIQKIDSARRCSLYFFKLSLIPTFNINNFWFDYSINSLKIKNLPGVFSQKHLDEGSRFLLDSILFHAKDLSGDFIDLGCGSGILSAYLMQHFSKNLTATLVDISAAALESSKATFRENQLCANFIASDMFSEIHQKFDLIISNPPFHDGRKTDHSATKRFITDLDAYLNKKGRVYFVANHFLPYEDPLKKIFPHFEIINENTKFKVFFVQKL